MRVASAVAILVSLVVGSVSGNTIEYTVTDLGTLPDYSDSSSATGINDSGQIVGNAANSSGATHAFIYSGGTMKDLGTLGGNNSIANGISDNGQVAGWANTGDGSQYAFLYSGGTMKGLGTLGNFSNASSVNNNGQVVGSFNIEGGYHAFLYTGGTTAEIGKRPDVTNSSASAINNSGLVVGIAYNTSYVPYAFLYNGGSMTSLGTLGGLGSGPAASTA